MNQLVRLRSASFVYAADPAVEDVDLDVEEADFIGIVGPSGSGKTTLLKLMAGALSPSAGEVIRKGTRLGYVPQVDTVNRSFPVTVAETLFMAMRGNRHPRPTGEERRRASELLQKLGLGGLESRHIGDLSGGQQQRVLIARALVDRPRLLLMDEPTGGIDVASRHEIMHILHDLHHEGIAVVITTHDLNGVAAHLPHVVCLNRRVIASGAPPEVLTSGVLEATYGAPLDVLIHAGLPVVVDRLAGGGHHEHPS